MQFDLYERIATSERFGPWVVLLLGALLALILAALVAFTSPVIAAAAVAAVIAGAIIFSSIDFGLYALVGIAVLLSFASIPINLGFNPTLLDLALVAAFAMWLARSLTRQE